MKLILIFCSLIMLPACANFKSQELQPVIPPKEENSSVMLGRTYNVFQGSRILASKKRNYPFLDQLEELVYPGKNFESENPGKRLERLEIAVFGNKQNGSIAERTESLEQEIEGWQIANAQALSIINSKTQASKTDTAFNYQEPEKQNLRHQAYSSSAPYPQYSLQSTVQARSIPRTIDYDYQNYRMASPLIRDMGRRTIDLLFSR